MEPEISWNEGTIREDTKEIVEHFIRHYVHENIKPAPESFYDLDLIRLKMECEVYDPSEFDETTFRRQVKEVAGWLGIDTESFNNTPHSPDMDSWGMWPPFYKYKIVIAGGDMEDEVLLLDISGKCRKNRDANETEIYCSIGKIASAYEGDKRCMEFYVEDGPELKIHPLKFREYDAKKTIAIGGYFKKGNANRIFIPECEGQIWFLNQPPQ